MKGNSRNKVGNRKGGPAFRTPSSFRVRQTLKIVNNRQRFSPGSRSK